MKYERINKIESYLKIYKTCSLDNLCDVFNVSKNTIRRDISELESRHVLRKVYGGVTLINNDDTVHIQKREKLHTNEKTMIGELASELIVDGDIIFVDSGSTTIALIPFLEPKQNVTIITHSLSAITEASLLNNITLVSTGGIHQQKTNSFTGISTVNFLKTVNITKAFMATTGLSIDKGITNTTYLEAEIKQLIVTISDKIILMADCSKFNQSSFMRYCQLDEINYMITNQKPTHTYTEFFEQNNIVCLFPK